MSTATPVLDKDFGIANSLKRLGIKEVNNGAHTGTKWISTTGENLESFSPADGKLIGTIKQATANDYENIITLSQEAFEKWRLVPAPLRGEVVRQIGNALRENKEDLGRLVSYEMGKIYQEGLGEVQEMID